MTQFKTRSINWYHVRPDSRVAHIYRDIFKKSQKISERIAVFHLHYCDVLPFPPFSVRHDWFVFHSGAIGWKASQNYDKLGETKTPPLTFFHAIYACFWKVRRYFWMHQYCCQRRLKSMDITEFQLWMFNPSKLTCCQICGLFCSLVR